MFHAPKALRPRNSAARLPGGRFAQGWTNGRYTVAVKVIDNFENDTMAPVPVDVG